MEISDFGFFSHWALTTLTTLGSKPIFTTNDVQHGEWQLRLQCLCAGGHDRGRLNVGGHEGWGGSRVVDGGHVAHGSLGATDVAATYRANKHENW
jgi:hypothetical protein